MRSFQEYDQPSAALSNVISRMITIVLLLTGENIRRARFSVSCQAEPETV
jgi:hypothetical protein